MLYYNDTCKHDRMKPNNFNGKHYYPAQLET